MNNICTRIEPVIVPIKNDNSRIYLPESLIMRKKEISFINLAYDALLTNDTLATSDIKNDYLVLVSDSREIINKIPLFTLFKFQQVGCPLEIKSSVDFQSSYILRTGNNRSENIGKSYCLLFAWNEAKEQQPQGRYWLENISAKFTPNEGWKRIYFEDKESFRGRKLKMIYPCSQEDIETSPDYNEITSASENLAASITLVDTAGREVINKIPLSSFDKANTTSGFPYIFNDLQIDWSKSYVDVYTGAPVSISAPGGITAASSIAPKKEIYINLLLSATL